MGSRSVHIGYSEAYSHPTSEESEDDDELLEPGVHVSSAGASPPYSEVHPQSQSGSSSHPGDFVHLHYPNELHEPEVYPYDSASRLDRHDRNRGTRSHSHSHRREHSAHHRRPPAQGAPRPRQRPPRGPPPAESSPTESGDSTEEFLEKSDYGPGMPRPRSYYAPNGYPQSSSSGSFGYPSVPQPGQMIHYAPPHQAPAPPMHPHYQQPQHPQYPPVSSPPPMPYPPGHPGYHPGMGQHPAGRGGPQYRQPPYGPSAVMPYPPHQGYYGHGYPGQYPPHYQQPPPNPYAPGLPQFMHDWQVASHSRVASPPAATPEKKPEVDQDEIIKRMEMILIAANAEREGEEKKRQLAIQSASDQAAAIRKAEQERAIEEARIRADAIREAREQAEAAARAQKERAAEEARIREDAIRAAHQAMADKAAAEAEREAREKRIRKEAADAALEAAAASAKAQADQAAKEAKIAADAADAAKTSAEKKASDEAKAAEEAAKKVKDDAEKKAKELEEAAEKKVKELEEAAAKAKAEAEVATAAAAAAAPPEKKAPVRFKDAIGRNYNFPWERCCKWRDMEGLIVQAFQHIEEIGEHVIHGRYDLIGPDQEIIMPQYWDMIVQPDMHITMMLWPLPEKPPPEPELAPLPEMVIPPPPEGVIDLDELLNPRNKSKKNGKKPKGSAFSNWMLGGAPSRGRKALKDDKKPGSVAV